MSRPSGRIKAALDDKPESLSGSSDEGEEGVPASNREETPDLYRNSALGMYVHIFNSSFVQTKQLFSSQIWRGE